MQRREEREGERGRRKKGGGNGWVWLLRGPILSVCKVAVLCALNAVMSLGVETTVPDRWARGNTPSSGPHMSVEVTRCCRGRIGFFPVKAGRKGPTLHEPTREYGPGRICSSHPQSKCKQVHLIDVPKFILVLVHIGLISNILDYRPDFVE